MLSLELKLLVLEEAVLKLGQKAISRIRRFVLMESKQLLGFSRWGWFAPLCCILLHVRIAKITLPVRLHMISAVGAPLNPNPNPNPNNLSFVTIVDAVPLPCKTF